MLTGARTPTRAAGTGRSPTPSSPSDVGRRRTGPVPGSADQRHGPGPGHVAALDGLRGLAFLTVLAYHLRSGLLPTAGYVGVDLFFGLSGFLITALIVQEWQRTGGVSLRRFAARRALRLLPALGTFLACYLVVAAAFGHQPWFGGVPGAAGPAAPVAFTADLHAAAGVASYLYNLAIAYHWRWGEGAPVGHLWTLSVEVQFYLVWGVLLAGLLCMARRGRRLSGRGVAPSRRERSVDQVTGRGRRLSGRGVAPARSVGGRGAVRSPGGSSGAVERPVRASGAVERPVRASGARRTAGAGLAATGALALAGASVAATFVVWGHAGGSHFAYFSTWTRSQGLLLGAAAGLWWASGALHRFLGTRVGQAVGAALCTAAGGWLVAAVWEAPLGSAPGAATVATAGMSVACALLVALVAARPAGALARACRMGWLRYVGRRSYALYLWHYPLLAWFRGDGALGDVIAVGLAFAMAELSWRLVERRALQHRPRTPDPPGDAPASAGAVDPAGARAPSGSSATP